MTGEKARNVLEEDEPGSVSPHKVEEGEGEDAALSGEPSSLASDAEVLAGEAAGPESSTAGVFVADRFWTRSSWTAYSEWPCCQSNDVTEVRDSGPSLGKDGVGVRVDLGEGDGSPTGALKPKVKPADSAEEAGVGCVTHRIRGMSG